MTHLPRLVAQSPSKRDCCIADISPENSHADWNANTALREGTRPTDIRPALQPKHTILNRILWRAAKGSQTPYPAWAVKAVDDD
jgi:hypothetical protein